MAQIEKSMHYGPDSLTDCLVFSCFQTTGAAVITPGRRRPFPVSCTELYGFERKKAMRGKRHYIELEGQKVEVNRELYEAYVKGYRKERYFTHDLKKERRRVDEKTGEVRIIPSREDSYERLLEVEKRFMAEVESVEDAAIRAVMLEKLNEALYTLTSRERGIIYALFYEETSEMQLAKEMGIARTTLRSQKEGILKKIKKMLKI